MVFLWIWRRGDHYCSGQLSSLKKVQLRKASGMQVRAEGEAVIQPSGNLPQKKISRPLTGKSSQALKITKSKFPTNPPGIHGGTVWISQNLKSQEVVTRNKPEVEDLHQGMCWAQGKYVDKLNLILFGLLPEFLQSLFIVLTYDLTNPCDLQTDKWLFWGNYVGGQGREENYPQRSNAAKVPSEPRNKDVKAQNTAKMKSLLWQNRPKLICTSLREHNHKGTVPFICTYTDSEEKDPQWTAFSCYLNQKLK